jgi:hypothetical protein
MASELSVRYTTDRAGKGVGVTSAVGSGEAVGPDVCAVPTRIPELSKPAITVTTTLNTRED